MSVLSQRYSADHFPGVLYPGDHIGPLGQSEEVPHRVGSYTQMQTLSTTAPGGSCSRPSGKVYCVRMYCKLPHCVLYDRINVLINQFCTFDFNCIFNIEAGIIANKSFWYSKVIKELK